MIERRCEECGKIFEVYPSSKQKLCSMKCMGKAQSRRQLREGNANWKDGVSNKVGVSKYNKKYRENNKTRCINCNKLCDGKRCRKCRGISERREIELTCKECKIKFQVIPAKKDNKYCSKKCYNKSQIKRVKIVCEVCGRIKYLPYCCSTRKFCSNKCKGIAKTGQKNLNWKGGLTLLNHRIRDLRENKIWRISVFKRDNYTCAICGKIGGYIEAHHIISFNDIMLDNNITSIEDARLCIELWDINNGVTVCTDCHTDIDEYRFKGKVR